MYKYELVEGKVCGTCIHYRQHYILSEGEYDALWYGHCRCPRAKKRAPEQTCAFWEPAETQKKGKPRSG